MLRTKIARTSGSYPISLYRTPPKVGARDTGKFGWAAFPLILSLAACGAMTIAVKPVSPADIAAIELSATIAINLGADYTSLPLCPVQKPICADPTLKAEVKAKSLQLYTAVKTLQKASADGTPAAFAVVQTYLQNLQSSIPVKTTIQ